MFDLEENNIKFDIKAYEISLDNDFLIKIVSSDIDTTIFVIDFVGNLYWGSTMFDDEREVDFYDLELVDLFKTNIVNFIYKVSDKNEDIRKIYKLYETLVFSDDNMCERIYLDYKLANSGKYYFEIPSYNVVYYFDIKLFD